MKARTPRTGAAQFKDWMKRRGVNQREACKLLGWDETFLSKILRGHRRPGRDNCVHLETITGIPVRSW